MTAKDDQMHQMEEMTLKHMQLFYTDFLIKTVDEGKEN